MAQKTYHKPYNKLNEPLNPGGPSINEIVKDWILANPEKTKEECAEETGVSLEVLNRFWVMLVVSSDIPSEELTQLNLMKSWIRHFPEGTRSDCRNDLHFNLTYISDHWEECGGKKQGVKQIEKDRITIQQWVEEHPNGTRFECYMDTKIVKKNIDKFWPENMSRDSYYDHVHRKHLALVSQWLKDNPDGRVSECAAALRMDRHNVEKVWKEAGGSDANICTAVEAETKRRQQLITEWIKSGKEGGVMQCAADIGLPDNYVSRHWKKCGGSPLVMMEQRGLKLDAKIKEWLEKNPLGTLKQCSRETGISKTGIRPRWTRLGGKSLEAIITIKISEYIASHPDGTVEDCAKVVDLLPGTVRKRFDKCKDSEYCQQIINSTSENENVKNIRIWIASHPDGTPQECADTLGICKATVITYWTQAGGRSLIQHRKERPSVIPVETDVIRISKWLKDNPEGTKQECMSATGLSRERVQKNWKEAGGLPKHALHTEKCKATIIQWFEEHPEGNSTLCAEATGISVTAVCGYMKKLGIFQKREEQNIEMLKTWISNNPLGSMFSCEKETGLSGYFIRAHWKEFGGSEESFSDRAYLEAKPILKKWWEENPNGSLAKCHEQTGIGRTRILRYLSEREKEEQ